MKIKVPSKTVEACDICKRETAVLTACLVCGKEHCWICRAIMAGCIVQPDVCKECGDMEAVIKIVDRFTKPLAATVVKRRQALRRLNRK